LLARGFKVIDLLPIFVYRMQRIGANGTDGARLSRSDSEAVYGLPEINAKRSIPLMLIAFGLLSLHAGSVFTVLKKDD